MTDESDAGVEGARRVDVSGVANMIVNLLENAQLPRQEKASRIADVLVEGWRDAAERLTTAQRTIEELRAWVNDLQSGMYINCVYCGHRYGPSDEVPASMADVLKSHVEQCPEHPMSQLRRERDEAREEAEKAKKHFRLSTKVQEEYEADNAALRTQVADLTGRLERAEENRAYWEQCYNDLLPRYRAALRGEGE